MFLAHARDLLDFFGGQLEGKHPQIVAQSLLLGAGGDGHNVLLNYPSQENLARTDSVFLGQRGQQRVEWPAAGFDNGQERPVGCEFDVFVFVICHQISVLQVWMELDLIDSGPNFGSLEDRLEVWLEEVADTNTLRLPTRGHLFHLRPFLLELGVGIVTFGEERRMDQIEVDIVQPQLLQTRVDGAGDILNVGNHFGGDEELVARHAALLDGIAQLLFGIVDLGAVQVRVSRLDRQLGGIDQFLVLWRIRVRLVPCRARAIADL